MKRFAGMAVQKLIGYPRRQLRLWRLRRRMRGRLEPRVSLFCNNCLGGRVLHDLGLRFNSPTVNFSFAPSDLVEMLSNLPYWLAQPLEDVTSAGDPWPTGLLGGRIKIYFIHYSSFESARDAWLRRVARVDYRHIRAVLVQRDGCTDDDIRRFLALPGLERRLVLARRRPEGCSPDQVVEITGCADGTQLAMDVIIGYEDIWRGRMYYDQVDWSSFLSRT